YSRAGIRRPGAWGPSNALRHGNSGRWPGRRGKRGWRAARSRRLRAQPCGSRGVSFRPRVPDAYPRATIRYRPSEAVGVEGGRPQAELMARLVLKLELLAKSLPRRCEEVA